MENKFVSAGADENEFSIGVKIPYVGVVLTKEQADEVIHRTMEFYSTDGKTLFEIRDKEGKSTGEWMFFVVFK